MSRAGTRLTEDELAASRSSDTVFVFGSGYADRAAADRGIELSALNPRSLLAEVMPVYSFPSEEKSSA